jgi:predicted amidohydrolase
MASFIINPERTGRVSKRILNVALVQFPRLLHEQEANLERALGTLEEIAGADIVLFPEVWMGAAVHEPQDLENLLGGISAVAERKRFFVLTGGLFVNFGNYIADVCHIIGSDGRILGEQRKLFPSCAVGERIFCTGGDGLAVFECSGWKCGVVICVDLFYPEITRELALGGVELVFNPANIPAPRNDMWHGLARTRAAENTVFVAYANNTNSTYRDGRKVMGESMIAGPTGDIIASASSEPGILRAELDQGRIPDQRGRWPYLEDIKELRALGKPQIETRELNMEIVI